MELIGVFGRGRLERELRRREAALREAAQATDRPEPEPKSPVTRSGSTPRRWWQCDFCGRGFHSYGRFLNHHCHGEG